MVGQILSLTINEEHDKTQDSFSSQPDTAHNKGALAFLTLVEEYLANRARQEEEIKFENLLVLMMDVDISKRVPTPDAVAPLLNSNGWDMQQVSSVWSVSTTKPSNSVWDNAGIEALAGKGAVSRIWNQLKADNLTGFPKRRAEEHGSGVACNKRLKVSSIDLSCQTTTPSKLEDSAVRASPIDTLSLSCPRKHSRRKVRARRSDAVGLKNKITWWFGRQQDTPDTPEAPRTPKPNDSPFPADPSPLDPSLNKSRKPGSRKRGRRSKKQAVQSPNHRDASPCLQQRRSTVQVLKPKKNSFPESSAKAKTTEAGSASKDGQHAAATTDGNRKWNPAADATSVKSKQ